MAERLAPRMRQPLLVVLCLFLLVSALWAFVVPIRDSQGAPSSFQPDEPNHIAVITYIAKNAALPPYTIEYYESVHPPLYHLAAAGVYHLARPVLGLDGTVRLLRLLGGCLGAALVWLVWRTALPLLRAPGALLAAALAGGIPMFVSISASATNETLAALAAAGALAGLTAGVRLRQFDWRSITTIALWTAVGAGTKVTCLGLLPVSLAVVWAVGNGSALPRRKIAAQLALILLITLAVSGWWYARNAALYGDPLRRAEASAMWQERIPGYAALAAQGKTNLPRYAARVTVWGWASFWGVFDAFRRPFPTGVYACLACFQAICLYGLYKQFRQLRLRKNPLYPLILYTAPFAVTVAMVYYRYTWDHYTPQGRFFFPLLLPFAVLTAAGWLALWRTKRKSRAERPVTDVPVWAMGSVIAALTVLNGFALVQAGQAAVSLSP